MANRERPTPAGSRPLPYVCSLLGVPVPLWLRCVSPAYCRGSIRSSTVAPSLSGVRSPRATFTDTLRVSGGRLGAWGFGGGGGPAIQTGRGGSGVAGGPRLAGVGLARRHRASDRRQDPALAELGLVAFDFGLRGVAPGPCGFQIAPRLVDLVGGDHIFFAQSASPLQPQLRHPSP